MKYLYKYLIYGLFILSHQALAQSFTTKVSSKNLGKKDLIEVEYIAENLELSDFQLPQFKGWNIQSGPNFSSRQEQVGNKVKQKIIYSFVLQPLRTGKLSIPSATITIDRNNIRQSNTITVDVKNVDHIAGNSIATIPQLPSLFDDPPVPQDDFAKDQVLKKGENVQDKIKNNILFRVDVNKTSCYVGEPIIATYKLCTRVKSESRVVKQPAFNGCTVTELTTDNPSSTREVINGRMYNVYIVRKVQLLPLQEGEINLPAASVENKVSFYKTSNINFRDLYYDRSAPEVEQVQITLSNKPLNVTVKPLPTDAPQTFNGAIGNFRIASIPADDKPITTKSSAGFVVIVEGTGNLQQTKTPVIQWPAGIEGFDAVEHEEIDKNSNPVVVRKTYTYPFVVSKPGNYTIPPVQFNYFNPGTGKYVTISSQPFLFNAAKGSNAIFSVINKNNDPDFETRLYIILGGALIAIAAGLLYFNSRYKKVPAVITPSIPDDQTPVTIPQNIPVTDQYIHNISDLNPIENKGFYKQLHKELSGYLKTRFNIDENEIDTLALSRPQDADTLVRVKALLSDCRLGMYTPMFNTEEELKHRLQAIEILTKLEKR